MNRTPSDIDDVTQLYVDVGTHGWSDLIVARKGELLSFRVSEVFTSMPANVLDLCNAILNNISLRVALCDEPGGVVIEVKPDEFQHHAVAFMIHEIEGRKVGFDAREEGTIIFETKFKRQRLIAMLMSELWKTHKSLSEPSYQIGRGNFPHHELRTMNKAWDDSPLGPSFLN